MTTSNEQQDHKLATDLIRDLLHSMPEEVLVAILPLLSELVRLVDGCRTRDAARRFARRLYCTLRYRELLNAPGNRTKNKLEITTKVQAEVRQRFNGFRCSRRALQSWIAAWNHIGEAGMAAAWTGCRMPMIAGLRHGHRSPEAVSYFLRTYAREPHKPVSECHRLTLDAAIRKGWRWPKTSCSTYTWIRTIGLSRRQVEAVVTAV